MAGKDVQAQFIAEVEDELRVGPMDLARINAAFMLAYGLGMMFVGRFIDRVGTRVGLAITFLLWSIASAGHALVYSVAGLIVIRILTGLGIGAAWLSHGLRQWATSLPLLRS